METYWKRPKAHPLAYTLPLIGLTLLALAFVAHFAMQAGTRHGARRTVPDFSGIPLEEAQRIALRNDLTLFINDSLFVPAYEGGIVLDQLPAGGVEVKPGRTVYVTINSFRQKSVPVPYVAGRSLRQAKNMLEIAGLEIEELIYRPDMATNYVLEEYCDGRPVQATSRIEAEMGSGVTLYVGVEAGAGPPPPREKKANQTKTKKKSHTQPPQLKRHPPPPPQKTPQPRDPGPTPAPEPGLSPPLCVQALPDDLLCRLFP